MSRDTRNRAHEIYTAAAKGTWTFNATGTVNPLVGGYPWTGNEAGVTPPANGWTVLTDGTRPKTDAEGKQFNEEAKRETWIAL
ncbi:hypothetical protein [Fontivita pretiosa]|uniref:hypothetical protein n=1 Tax=Fontivita pretiosa TaxID=2989684 RepID=UPI003D171081